MKFLFRIRVCQWPNYQWLYGQEIFNCPNFLARILNFAFINPDIIIFECFKYFIVRLKLSSSCSGWKIAFSRPNVIYSCSIFRNYNYRCYYFFFTVTIEKTIKIIVHLLRVGENLLKWETQTGWESLPLRGHNFSSVDIMYFGFDHRI